MEREKPMYDSDNEELPDEIHRRITELSEAGDALANESHYEHAIRLYKEALQLLPEPKDRWEAGTWLLVAIGDALYYQGGFNEAHTYFRAAQKYPDGLENPLIFLRIGECLVEMGNDEDEAADALMRAYMLEGAEIFENEDPKYLRFLKEHADIEDPSIN
jgi:tetratricopeptide (TPR) repeat protein